MRSLCESRGFLAALLATLLAACGGGEGSEPAAPSDAGNDAAGDGCEASPILITDDTNYSITSTISIQRSVLKDASDLLLDWSGVTVDYFGKEIDPLVDIDNVVISLWGMTPEELEENLRIDNLPLRVNKGAITTYPNDAYTQMNLLGFDLFGNPLLPEDIWPYFDTMHPDYEYPQDTHTYMVTAGSGTAAGRGTHMMTLFHLDPAAEQTELFLSNELTTLDYTVTLSGARPVRVPRARADLVIDWREMTTNALGNPYPLTQITQAVVAHFESESLAELEARFLDLEEIAIGWWSAEVVAGAGIDLSTLLDAESNPFPGIDDTGTWMVALFCTASCNHPAPWSITQLRACD